MTSRERFLASARSQSVDRRPVWIMRQAGRYLPEYRKLKEQHDFLTLVKTPDLAAEVTLQPLKRFPLDAAVIFSDILTIPEAMGQPYHFASEGGIAMDFKLDSTERIRSLEPAAVRQNLDYVAKAIKNVRKELGKDKAVLGFCGSPWTLAVYMIEGGSSNHAEAAKALYFSHRVLFDELMEMLCEALVDYLLMQIDAGADALQIFDSWAGIAPDAHYENLSLKWIRRILRELPADVPTILFAKGAAHHLPRLIDTGASVFSVDWTADMSAAAGILPDGKALQGNLDPAVLTLDDPATVRAETLRVLQSVPPATGHIFNLGHGITPQAKIENVEMLAQTVVDYALPK